MESNTITCAGFVDGRWQTAPLMHAAALQAIVDFSERGRAPEATKKQVAEILQLQPHQVHRPCRLPSEGRDAHQS